MKTKTPPKAKAKAVPKPPPKPDAAAELHALLLAIRDDQQRILHALEAKAPAAAPLLATMQQALGGLDLAPGQMEAVNALLQTHLAKR